jgi:hypothetical protein
MVGNRTCYVIAWRPYQVVFLRSHRLFLADSPRWDQFVERILVLEANLQRLHARLHQMLYRPRRYDGPRGEGSRHSSGEVGL